MKTRFFLTFVGIIAMLGLVAWSAASPPDTLPDYTFDYGEDGSYEAPYYSIGDFLWWDDNGNGLQNEGEDGVGGVEVSLFNSEGDHLASTLTNEFGEYEFSNLDVGEYYVQFYSVENAIFTLQNQGEDNSVDSDVDPSSGQSDVFVVGEEDNFSVDAGLVEQPELDAIGGGSGEAENCYGPNPEDFPEGISPLTGLPVADPESLYLRPVFVSISLFPPSVRPPTGLSDSPVVYQFTIGDGDTRLLAAFHGDYPGDEFQSLEGGENVYVPEDADLVVGDRVWFDMNGNSLQDSNEPGVPGVYVTLYVNGHTFAETVTDGAGYYYFVYDEAAGDAETLQLEFDIPGEYADYYFVSKDVGDNDSVDSDVYVEGFTEVYAVPSELGAINFDVDAGVRQSVRIEGVRSGRVFFEDIRVQYCGCVVAAGADPAVAAQIQTCGFAASSDVNNIGASGLDISQLGNIATQNSEGSACYQPNLSGNVFCNTVPSNGAVANELYTYWNVNNRDHFVYDAEAGAYAWHKNLPSSNESFELLTDRLNGETLFYENVIIMIVNHTQMNAAGTIFEMDLATNTGRAYILRNGMVFEASWSTINGEYEQTTGLLRPFRFLDADGNPFPFAPGQTMVNMLHSYYGFEEIDEGVWKARFYAPAYSD